MVRSDNQHTACKAASVCAHMALESEKRRILVEKKIVDVKINKNNEKLNLIKCLAYDFLAFNEGKFCSKGRSIRNSKYFAISRWFIKEIY